MTGSFGSVVSERKTSSRFDSLEAHLVDDEADAADDPTTASGVVPVAVTSSGPVSVASMPRRPARLGSGRRRGADDDREPALAVSSASGALVTSRPLSRITTWSTVWATSASR